MLRAVYVIALLSFALGTVGLVARYLPVTNHVVLFLAALSPFLMPAAFLAAVLFIVTHHWWAAALAVLLSMAVGAVMGPQFVRSGQLAGSTVPIRVLTANLHDTADPAAVAAAAREHADILLVQELNPDLADALTERYLSTDFPYRVLDAKPEAAGVGIWSRYPLTHGSRISRYPLGAITATVRAPGAAADTVVMSIHLAGPWPQPIDDWRRDIAAVPETLRQVAADAGSGTVIVGGDFNATSGMKPFRDLLRDGFRNAAEQSGDGFTATYPADGPVRLIGIDHILTRNGGATDARSVTIAGTDHRGLAATIHVPG